MAVLRASVPGIIPGTYKVADVLAAIPVRPKRTRVITHAESCRRWAEKHPEYRAARNSSQSSARELVYAYVVDVGGATSKQVARDLDMPVRSAQGYLQKLRMGGRLRAEYLGGHDQTVIYYPVVA